jgi:hypothetical protein
MPQIPPLPPLRNYVLCEEKSFRVCTTAFTHFDASPLCVVYPTATSPSGRPVFTFLGVAAVARRPSRRQARQPRALQSALDRQGPNSAIIILVGFMSGGASVFPECTEECVSVSWVLGRSLAPWHWHAPTSSKKNSATGSEKLRLSQVPPESGPSPDAWRPSVSPARPPPPPPA